MKKILLDTNFLLIPIQFKLDIFTEIRNICNFKYKLYILDKTIEELNNIIEKQKGKNKDAAKFALKLVKFKKINIIKTKEKFSVDRLIVETANKKAYIVATLDKPLKKQLKLKNIALIVLRQKKRLVLDGNI
ncbi:hypothetical protein ISS05_01675 [Candidatus Woesearchaeota archaeon]|nr:hypothetical protein [Candidatus Woesearchaeota archaeon]